MSLTGRSPRAGSTSLRMMEAMSLAQRLVEACSGSYTRRPELLDRHGPGAGSGFRFEGVDALVDLAAQLLAKRRAAGAVQAGYAPIVIWRCLPRTR